MSGDPSHLITVTWSAYSAGGPNDAYVTEFTDGQLSLTYGPMPMAVTGEFITQRKNQIAEIFDRVIRRLNDGKDQTHQDEPLAGEALS